MIKLRERQVVCQPWRINVIVLVLLLVFSSLCTGAAYRNIMQGDMLVNESTSRYINNVSLNGERGVIWDRNGRPLAMSSVVYSAHINPILFNRYLTNKDEKLINNLYQEISDGIGIDIDELKDSLSQDKGFIYLQHDLIPEVVDNIKLARIPYLGFEKRFRRFYPSAQEAAHITGFLDYDGNGITGIEANMHQFLNPIAGEKLVLRTTNGRVLEEFSRKPAVDGNDVTLTIDSRLQYFASIALAKVINKHKAKTGSLILMDVKNGDILALANMPTFNPNNISPQVNLRRNRAIQDIFEPGSTMKPILAAIAMEHGLITEQSLLATKKPIRFGKYLIQDKKIDTDLTTAEIIMRSSNVGAVRIAELLEDEIMWQGYNNFGFGSENILGITGETSGKLRNWETWREVEKATMAYGYGLSANLLQLTRAYAAIANNGYIPSPGLILNEERQSAIKVITPATAKRVIRMLETVVSEKGTAIKASINGYKVAGKTGTTHKRLEKVKGYDKKLYQSVFVGFAPASNPRFVCAVFIDEPTDNGYYGGTVAAPVFANVMGHALRLYSIPTDNVDLLDEPVLVADQQTAENLQG